MTEKWTSYAKEWDDQNEGEIMQQMKKIKIGIIVGLLLLEGFVWTAGASASAPLLNANEGGASDPVNIYGEEAAAIGIIGSADGPTTVVVSRGPSFFEQQQVSKEPTEEERNVQKAEHRQLALEVAKEKGLLILANKQHALDKNYRPEDLKEIHYFAPDRDRASRYMCEEAADAFHELVESAELEEIELVMTTAYRGYDFQKTLFDNYVAREGLEAANRYSAKPGESEHQTGLAVDVSSGSVRYQLTEEFGKTKEGIWLAKNAHLFGFIIRYPQGQEKITGYLYEPWHLRYVGQPAATEIYEQGLTLEEFLTQNEID